VGCSDLWPFFDDWRDEHERLWHAATKDAYGFGVKYLKNENIQS
jgi:hypothetical protein